MISERNFKHILNSLWTAFTASAGLIDGLEKIGLNVCASNDEDRYDGDFRALYRIQDTLSKTILTICEIDSDTLAGDGHGTVLEELDAFFFRTFASRAQRTAFPDDKYPVLLQILKDAGCILPWEVTGTQASCRLYRAVEKETGLPVYGYLWAGATHAYITPTNLGISYDEKDRQIFAYAVEVLPETIAMDMLDQDSNGHYLFEGDTVRIGKEEFKLSMADPQSIARLNSQKRKQHGLKLVQCNYE